MAAKNLKLLKKKDFCYDNCSQLRKICRDKFFSFDRTFYDLLLRTGIKRAKAQTQTKRTSL